jgi:methylmalonyl-CoA/ethylmalonyl-CoA epimerase
MSHKINHLAVVVANLDDALKFWRDALGMVVERTEQNLGEQVNITFMAAGSSYIELLEPTDSESGIGKYLAKKGAGLHHLCLEVQDIEAAMQRLKAHHIELINDVPKTRASDGIRYCFIHPKSAGGVLVELYELPR